MLTRNLNGELGLLFDPCVNAMGWQPYWPSCMEASYCTFGFGAICTHYRYRVIRHGKGNLGLTKLFYLLSYEKIGRFNNITSVRVDKMAVTTNFPFKFPWMLMTCEYTCAEAKMTAKFVQVLVKIWMNIDVTCDRSLEDLDGWQSQDVIREGVPSCYSSWKKKKKEFLKI